MNQLSVSPALFFRVKAKTALACLMASFRSASDAPRALLISSKAAEEGKASKWIAMSVVTLPKVQKAGNQVPFLRDMVAELEIKMQERMRLKEDANFYI